MRGSLSPSVEVLITEMVFLPKEAPYEVFRGTSPKESDLWTTSDFYR